MFHHKILQTLNKCKGVIIIIIQKRTKKLFSDWDEHSLGFSDDSNESSSLYEYSLAFQVWNNISICLQVFTVQVYLHFDPNKMVSVDYLNQFNHGLYKTFTLVSDFVKCYKISFT